MSQVLSEDRFHLPEREHCGFQQLAHVNQLVQAMLTSLFGNASVGNCGKLRRNCRQ